MTIFPDTGTTVGEVFGKYIQALGTAAGTVPTQVDYSDYRVVSGVKIPFRMIMTWTNGQNTFQFNEVRPNVRIDAARFARPAPFTPR